jgi:SAM-dependent methyltransferase
MSQHDEAVEAFAERLLDIFTGSILSKLIRIGYATGLLEAVAKAPATSVELASALRLDERYVREWLGAMATSKILVYDPDAATFLLPAAHAALLTGSGAANLAPTATLLEHFGQLLPEVERCFFQGGGVPYASYRPGFTEAMDDLWRRVYDDYLVEGFLQVAPRVAVQLSAGCRAADLGCGTGHALNLMAKAFPASAFFGYDLAPDAIDKARAEAADLAITNASFEVLDVARLPAEPAFEVIFAFDSIHDQVDPLGVLKRAHDALAPSGTFYMVDFKLSSDLANNLANPFAPMAYGVSLLHCMTVSLAEKGEGLGAAWGMEKALELLFLAGFSNVEVLDSPRPQNCIYLCEP